jgi:hypothetical protein
MTHRLHITCTNPACNHKAMRIGSALDGTDRYPIKCSRCDTLCTVKREPIESQPRGFLGHLVEEPSQVWI